MRRKIRRRLFGVGLGWGVPSMIIAGVFTDTSDGFGWQWFALHVVLWMGGATAILYLLPWLRCPHCNAKLDRATMSRMNDGVAVSSAQWLCANCDKPLP